MICSRICRCHYETDKVLDTDFVRCDINDLTIPHALCIEKNIVYYVISSKRGKPQCGDPDYWITLCEIISIKIDNNYG